MLKRALVAVLFVLGVAGGTGVATAPASMAAHADRDCPDFASQRAAQIYFIKLGGPKHDPDRLDADNDGIACDTNPAPYYYGTHLPPRATSIRLTVSATRRIAGEPLTYRVRVSPHHVRSVVLQRLGSNGWTKVKAGRTNRHGVWVVRSKARSATTTFRATVRSAKISGHRYASAGSTRRTVTIDRQQVSLSIPAEVTVGDVIRPVATVTPVRTGRAVVLQRLVASHWRTVKTGTESKSGGTSFSLSSTTPSTYSYRAVAQPRSGAKAIGSTSHALTIVAPDLPPSAPSSLVATPTDGEANLTWSPVDADDLAGYEVFEVPSGGGAPQLIGQPSGTAFTVTGLTNGTPYSYYVEAVDLARQESTPSSTVSVTPRDGTAPATPQAPLGSPGDGVAELSWSAVADHDVAGYRVYVADSQTGSYHGAGGGTLTGLSDEVTGLTNGTTYWFKITAVDTSGNESTLSDPTPVTPAAVAG